MRALLLLAASLVFQAEAAPPLVVGLDSVSLTVDDLDRSIDFYTQVLCFENEGVREVTGAPFEQLQGLFGVRMRTARLRLGGESLELTEYLAPKGRPAPADARSNDRWFQHVAIVVSDMEKAYQRLRQYKVRHASSGPQRLPDWNPQAGGIEAFYFRDPDGHPLEVIAFPPGKGQGKWHLRTDRLFLGIDHTAIAVADTAASVRFYRDTLGLQVVGESENYGTEQEHLNNVFGARLRITALRGAAGPGVEFLEYIAPQDGRAYPADEKPNDLIHCQTRFVAGDADEAGRAMQKARVHAVSAGVVSLPGGAYAKALVVRDPDGHAVEIAQRSLRE